VTVFTTSLKNIYQAETFIFLYAYDLYKATISLFSDIMNKQV